MKGIIGQWENVTGTTKGKNLWLQPACLLAGLLIN
jgi:hypothetical protein